MSQATSWNPEAYAAHARFVAELGAPVLASLQPKAHETILDLGCGDGALTAKIAAFGCTVYGIDGSLAQIQATKKRGVNAVVMDGHQLCFESRFDAVFSNAALHWMKEPEKVAAGVWNGLKPGGRFIGEFGGKGNIAQIRSALYDGLRKRAIDPLMIDPWYTPSTEEYSKLLAHTGFTVEYIELIRRPTRLPGDMRPWLEIFAQPFANAISPPPERERFLQEVRSELAKTLRDAQGNWSAGYVRLRFKASKQTAQR